MQHTKLSLFLCAVLVSSSALAHSTILDQKHQQVRNTLHNWSNTLDDWLGTPDPDDPASANLRLMLDNQWNAFDGYSIKPRVRAKIRLPALKKHFSLVAGDEMLDNQAQEKNQVVPNYKSPLEKDKRYDSRQTRRDNNSLALRWSDGIKRWGVDTDVDVGVRSGADVFLRVNAARVWQHSAQLSTRLEQIYRYGLNSKHYVRTNLDNKWVESERAFVNNHSYIEYTHDGKEQMRWGNSLYREHHFTGHKRLNYGIFLGGEIQKKSPRVTRYGPFVSWRQPVLREWLFIQPGLSLYNNKALTRPHHLGAFLRVEAIF
ncbi:MAG: hypothetical protein Q4A60_04825 [Pasteurellaceae bacterium]|nr:hypothetical protein [Pasteurellaceae bacterium]